MLISQNKDIKQPDINPESSPRLSDAILVQNNSDDEMPHLSIELTDNQNTIG